MLPFERCLVFQVELHIGEMNTALTLGIPFSELHTNLSDLKTAEYFLLNPSIIITKTTSRTLQVLEERHRHCKTRHPEIGKGIAKLEEGEVFPIESDGQVILEINGIPRFQGSWAPQDLNIQVQNKIQNQSCSPLSQDGEFKTIEWSQS